MFTVHVRNIFRQLQRRLAVSCAVLSLQYCVDRNQIEDAEQLRQRVEEEWDSLNQRLIDGADHQLLWSPATDRVRVWKNCDFWPISGFVVVYDLRNHVNANDLGWPAEIILATGNLAMANISKFCIHHLRRYAYNKRKSCFQGNITSENTKTIRQSDRQTGGRWWNGTNTGPPTAVSWATYLIRLTVGVTGAMWIA